LFYGTKKLIFPLDVQDNYLPNIFAVVSCNYHWSP